MSVRSWPGFDDDDDCSFPLQSQSPARSLMEDCSFSRHLLGTGAPSDAPAEEAVGIAVGDRSAADLLYSLVLGSL